MPYYRDVAVSFFPPITRVVKILLVATFGIFLATYALLVLFHWQGPFHWCGLHAHDVLHRFFVWQLVTCLFLHKDWFHVIFNLYALYIFGIDLERRWGPRRFTFYFFWTGVGAGVCDVVLNGILRPQSGVWTIGDSGAVFGLILAFAVVSPDRPILFAMIVPMKAKWFAALMAVIAFLSSFGEPGTGVSHVAHLGGLIFGAMYLWGRAAPFEWQLRLQEWRRARLRRQFGVYMRKHDKKDDPGRWVN